jgi:hypothetical protein
LIIHEVNGQPLGLLLIRPRDGEVDFVFISSMTASTLGLGSRVFTHEGTERRTVLQWPEAG